ncbi:hypothetical protein HDU88_009024 [Geranomyces variabilis]|nr:hypothetical protein HDU88_009024 [Geranomyces variabilis]
MAFYPPSFEGVCFTSPADGHRYMFCLTHDEEYNYDQAFDDMSQLVVATSNPETAAAFDMGVNEWHDISNFQHGWNAYALDAMGKLVTQLAASASVVKDGPEPDKSNKPSSIPLTSGHISFWIAVLSGDPSPHASGIFAQRRINSNLGQPQPWLDLAAQFPSVPALLDILNPELLRIRRLLLGWIAVARLAYGHGGSRTACYLRYIESRLQKDIQALTREMTV